VLLTDFSDGYLCIYLLVSYFMILMTLELHFVISTIFIHSFIHYALI